eukprot:TRINITY_DN1066_c0_g1_i3.p1 TRINITY_DN1066_c0_g1~~TRINITY_DN1066_c0_g1_i3.p1  ORF type:complete len:292 (-),score=80.25 TRINITY_DN1066_c0_g1_i3:223-1098(-)
MSLPTSVVVHPLVLLSVVDHYKRVVQNSRKRVIGVLLGETYKGRVDVTNSYAIPFEEDEKDPRVWFVDHNYHEALFSMFKKVSAKETFVGWYSTGPKIRPTDIEINEVFRKYVPNPLLVIIDVQPRELGLPTEAYVAVDDVTDETMGSKKTFVHIPSEIGALEAEEVGVEQLLRDITDASVSTLATQIPEKLSSLKGLVLRIHDIHKYLDNVLSGRIPINNQVIYHLQNILNLLPNLNVEEMVKSFAVKTNDMMLVIYLSSMIRSISALHNLISNKIALRDAERQEPTEAS